MFLEETANTLKQHAAHFDLEVQAIQCCKKYLHNYLAEHPEELRFYLRDVAIEELKFALVGHRLNFESYRSCAHIFSCVTFGCASENNILDMESFGTYDLETGENGEILDDWFSWDEMRDENGKLTEYSATD